MKNVLAAAIVLSFVAGLAGTAIACDQAEATAKFTKRAEQLSQPGAVPDDQIAAAWGQMNDAGTALSEGKYDEACALYDKVASDYGLEQ